MAEVAASVRVRRAASDHVINYTVTYDLPNHSAHPGSMYAEWLRSLSFTGPGFLGALVPAGAMKPEMETLEFGGKYLTSLEFPKPDN